MQHIVNGIEETKAAGARRQNVPQNRNNMDSIGHQSSINFTARDAYNHKSQVDELAFGQSNSSLSGIARRDVTNPEEESKGHAAGPRLHADPFDHHSHGSSLLPHNSMRSSMMPVNSRFAELAPHPYQLSIYNTIRGHWANDRNGYGNIVYLETGTGKTYIAIMLLKQLFAPEFVDYQDRLTAAKAAGGPRASDPLPNIELPEETDE